MSATALARRRDTSCGITIVYYHRLLTSFTPVVDYRRLLPSVCHCPYFAVGMLNRTKRDPPKSPPWVPGSPRYCAPGGLKFDTFLNLNFDQYFLDFGSHFGSLLEHFLCFLHPFFVHRICIVFSGFVIDFWYP